MEPSGGVRLAIIEAVIHLNVILVDREIFGKITSVLVSHGNFYFPPPDFLEKAKDSKPKVTKNS